MKRLITLLGAVFLAAALTAAAPAPVTHDFIAPGAVDFHALLTPPPPLDSIVARGEQELARNLQAVRTPEQAAMARYYQKLDVFHLLAPVLGDWCTAANLPRTAAVFQQVYRESRPTIEAAKASWNRQRPYVFDPTLQPAVERPNNTSYPSGHSADSALFAVVLSAVLPEHAADWQKQAALVRWSRVIGGAHYPSDTIAGKILGEALGREMLKSPKLQKDLEEVRAELLYQALEQQSKRANGLPVPSGPNNTPAPRPRLTDAQSTILSNRIIGTSNLGPIGLDTRWSEYGVYMNELIERVDQAWHRNMETSNPHYKPGSHVNVTFIINAKGEVKITSVENFADDVAVSQCTKAITNPGPFRKWTDQMVAVLGQEQSMTFGFYYY